MSFTNVPTTSVSVLNQGLDYFSWQSSAEKSFAPTFPTVSGTGAAVGYSSFTGWPTVFATTPSSIQQSITIPWPILPWYAPRTGTFQGVTATFWMGYSSFTPGYNGNSVTNATVTFQVGLWSVVHSLQFSFPGPTNEIITVGGTQVLSRTWPGTYSLHKYSVSIATDGSAIGLMDGSQVYTAPVGNFVTASALTPTFQVITSSAMPVTAHCGNLYLSYP